jgi:hypothetical protein
MKTLIWIGTAILVGLWSLIAWAAYALVGASGSILATNADIIPVDPELIEWASWLAVLGADVGSWLVIAIWGVVTAVMLAGAFIVTKLLPNVKTALPRA